MVFGVGTDLVDVTRFERLLSLYQERFILRFFHSKEILRPSSLSLRQRALHYSKRYAAKEAFVKAMGWGFGAEVGTKDIWVENAASGRPLLKMEKPLEIRVKEDFPGYAFQVHLSLTDEYPYAQAVAIISKEKE